MKETGQKTVCLEPGLTTIQMGACIEESGRAISTVARESISFPMGLSMKEHGKDIS